MIKGRVVRDETASKTEVPALAATTETEGGGRKNRTKKKQKQREPEKKKRMTMAKTWYCIRRGQGQGRRTPKKKKTTVRKSEMHPFFKTQNDARDSGNTLYLKKPVPPPLTEKGCRNQEESFMNLWSVPQRGYKPSVVAKKRVGRKKKIEPVLLGPLRPEKEYALG